MTQFPEPDPGTLSLARSGDREALGEILRQVQDPVLTLCYRVLGDRDLAEECAQEALLRVCRGLPTFQTARPFAPWLATVVINCARDSRSRRPQRGAPLEAASPREAQALGIDGTFAAGVREAVDALPMPYREAVALHYLCGLNCAEVARATGRSEGTVKSDLLRGRALLRRRMAPQFLEGGRP